MSDHKVTIPKAHSEEEMLKLVTEIVAAYVSKNPVAPEDLPGVIKSVHATLGGFGGDAAPPPRTPAVGSGAMADALALAFKRKG